MRDSLGCQVRRYADQMICAACGLNWDANDPEPPTCQPFDKRTKKAKATTAFETVKPQEPWRVPYVLRPEVAAEMAKSFHANCAYGDTQAMQAAYRIFLDRMEL